MRGYPWLLYSSGGGPAPGRPLQVLPAVQRQHLPGQRRQRQDGHDGARDLLGPAPWPSGTEAACRANCFLRLVRVGQRRAGADAVHPDARRERQRHGLGQRPQRGLGDGVGHEMRRQRPHPLVEHVDDHAPRRPAAGAGEVLHQHEGRAQVRFQMRVPGGAGGVVPLVALERAGVVDQHADRAERRGGRRQQAAISAPPASGRPAAARRDARRRMSAQVLRRPRAGMAVHGDVETGLGQRQRDGVAEPARAAGDQGGTRDARGDARGKSRGDGGGKWRHAFVVARLLR